MSLLNNVSSFAYKNVFRKTSTFALFIGVSAVFLDRGVDVVSETIWEKKNEGHLWKDVKKQLKLEDPK